MNENEDGQAEDLAAEEATAEEQTTPASSGTVTYSPEDNKLRLYVGRVPRDEYEALRKAGWTSTPKQSCDFVATWTPSREDQAREYLDEVEDIGDEDYSPEERAADRAERFGGYLDKRRTEAGDSADRYQAGPAVFGHQSQARAERQARRHDRTRSYAVSQWSKAEYWRERTAGVISHALHKSDARTRRGRILTLEAEQRKLLKDIAESQERYDRWQKVPDMEGANEPIKTDDEGRTKLNPAQREAYNLANSGLCFLHFYHPTNEAANARAREIWKHGFSPYDLLTKEDFGGIPFDPLSPRQVAEIYLAKIRNPSTPGTHSQRWASHLELRLTYEKQMLANEGGMLGEADIVPGGFIRGGRTDSCLTDADAGWKQVQAVSKSPATGRVTSVKVWGTSTGYTKESNYTQRATVPRLVSIGVGRLGEANYRAPTPEELAEFTTRTKERKKAEKATKPKPLPLINPTEEDAARLQATINEHASRRRNAGDDEGQVMKMTQADYSKYSKGAYSSFETRTIHQDGRPSRRSSNMWSSSGEAYDKSLPAAVFKLRMRAGRVVVLTDKPQTALPLDWDKIEAEEPAETKGAAA